MLFNISALGAFLKIMKQLLALFVTLTLGTLAAVAGESELRDPDQYFFAQSFKDLQEEAQISSEEEKAGIMVFFEMQGCPYCEHMRAHVFSDQSAQSWFGDNFRSIFMDIDGQTEAALFDGTAVTEKAVADHYGVFSTPTLIFFDAEGNEIYRHLKTARTPAELISVGESVLAKVAEK